MEQFPRAQSERASAGTTPPPSHEANADQPCATLNKLARYIRLRGMDWNARRVAQALCEYFDAECRRHRQEQECGLFTALQQQAREHSAPHVERLLSQLREQHQAIASLWEHLRGTLSDIAFCKPASLSQDDAARFTALYRAHVEFEERQLHPLTAQILGAGAVYRSSPHMTQ